MYLIALCDDEKRELDNIEIFLGAYRKSKESLHYKVQRFENAEELLYQVREKKYKPDILILDIFMSGKNGIEAAADLRKIGCNIPIVFLTTSTEYALRAFEVDAIQYILKPMDKERFFHAMDIAFRQVQKIKDSQIVVIVAGGLRRISSDDIIYCESQKNYQLIHLLNEEYKVRITNKELWGLLEAFPQFGRCGSPYILNMKHIVSIERDEISLSNGNTIYIPQKKAAEFRKEYFSYYFDEEDNK